MSTVDVVLCFRVRVEQSVQNNNLHRFENRTSPRRFVKWRAAHFGPRFGEERSCTSSKKVS